MFNRPSPASIAERLAKCAATSPEFWLFNPPATPKDLKKLETRLGWPIPEPLSSCLAQFNGGFVSPEGKVSIDSPVEISMARAKANRFLNCNEIDSAYKTLLSIHPDEDSTDFPFIPFMRLADGGFLACNAKDPLAAPYFAWTPDGPHLWKRLYPTFAAMLSDYYNKEGAILIEPYDDEPTALAEAY